MTPRRAIAAALIVLGAIWMGQGLGFIGGSFMTGDPTWAVIGAVLVVLAIAIAWLGPSARS